MAFDNPGPPPTGNNNGPPVPEPTRGGGLVLLALIVGLLQASFSVLTTITTRALLDPSHTHPNLGDLVVGAIQLIGGAWLTLMAILGADAFRKTRRK